MKGKCKIKGFATRRGMAYDIYKFCQMTGEYEYWCMYSDLGEARAFIKRMGWELVSLAIV